MHKYLQKLYESNINSGITVSEEDILPFYNFLRSATQCNASIDLICPKCCKEKTYLMNVNDCFKLKEFVELYNSLVPSFGHQFTPSHLNSISKKRGTMVLSFYCPECKSIYFMGVSYQNRSFIKVFEYPDQMKMKNISFKKFEKIENDFNYFLELATAQRLFNNGVYIGAIIYLRRVLERFIKVYLPNKMKLEKKFDSEKFKEIRDFKGHVKFVEPYLNPIILDSISHAYSIMSINVHELTEDDSKENYEILFEIVDSILSKEVAEIENANKLKALKARTDKTLIETSNKVGK